VGHRRAGRAGGPMTSAKRGRQKFFDIVNDVASFAPFSRRRGEGRVSRIIDSCCCSRFGLQAESWGAARGPVGGRRGMRAHASAEPLANTLTPAPLPPAGEGNKCTRCRIVKRLLSTCLERFSGVCKGVEVGSRSATVREGVAGVSDGNAVRLRSGNGLQVVARPARAVNIAGPRSAPYMRWKIALAASPRR
jgi:hypothetical protein